MACASHERGGNKGSSSLAKNGGKSSKSVEPHQLLGEVKSLNSQLNFEKSASEKAELALKSCPGASSDGGLCAPWVHIDQLDRVPASTTLKRHYRENQQGGSSSDSDVPPLVPSSGDEVDDARAKPLQTRLQREPLPRGVDTSDFIDPDDDDETYIAQLQLAELLRRL